MTGLFGILALILAAVGLYGVTAYTVERRTSEIGVRMALGREPRERNWTGFARRVSPGIGGLAIGIPAAIGGGHLMAAKLYQVRIWDPVVLSGSTLALAVCALLASIIPAHRAASINPVKALSTE